ncbi:hypothetical protein [Streptosporangium sp. NPDC002607]
MARRNDHDDPDPGSGTRGHASPYATGGGGVVLEHAYGAVLLACLLQQSPVRGLGDDVTPGEVRFQQGAWHPVDDVVAVGRCPTGERRMFVGVRRNPTIGAGSAPFVALLTDYLRMLVDHRAEFDSDRWRMGLAVAAPHTASAEVQTLAWIARRQRDDGEFRAAVDAPRATRGKIRERLRTLRAAVAVAAAQAELDAVIGVDELTWRLLRALRIIHLALEGEDPADRSRVIGELAKLVGGLPQAADLWRHLLELSSGYAQAAATVDRALLLRDLGTRLDLGPLGMAGRSTSHMSTADAGGSPSAKPVPGPAVVRVSEADPRRLGVHASIRVDGVDEDLPSYVERDVDGGEHGVRALLAKAARRGGFMLLVGGSSVGKTRCAYEAVRAVLPDWRLFHPAAAAEISALAGDPSQRTVLWLDEIQRYFGGERGLTSGTVRELLNAESSVVIVGTVWPDRYLRFTDTPAYGGADPHANERELIELADVVIVPETFSAAERRRAEAAAATDRLLATALATTGYGLTQTLAAAPQLVRRWEIAKTVHPYAWAVLLAALDVRLLGAEHALPEELLREAAPAYCTDRQRAEAPADWFEQGMAYTTRKLHGAAAALTCVGGAEMGQTVGYVIADYLLQHLGEARAAEPVPARVWEAIIAHLTDVDDVVLVAESAGARLLHKYAVPLYRRAADAGSRIAADQWTVHVGDAAGLADLRARAEDIGDGTLLRRQPAEAAAESLAEALVWRGELDQLRMLFRPTAFPSRGTGQRLARVLADRGANDELSALADRGDLAAAEQLAEVLARRGDGEELRARARFESSVDLPAEDDLLLGSRKEKREQTAARERLATYLAHRDELAELAARADAPATKRLFTLLRHRGDMPGLRRLAEARRGIVDTQLVEVLAHRGDRRELMSLAARGDEMLLDRIARVFVHLGDLDELEVLIRYGWTASDRLAGVLADRGDIARLRRFAARDAWAGHTLIKVLVCRGDLAALRVFVSVDTDGEAKQVLNTVLADRGALDELATRARHGDSDAARKLAHVLADRGDGEGAWRVLREAGMDRHRRITSIHDELTVDLDELGERAAAGDGTAASRLASALVRRGDLGRLRSRAGDGDSQAAFRLVDALLHRGDVDELRSLADGDHWYAAQELADVLVYRGRVDELIVRADSGDDNASRRLLDLLVHRGDLDALRRRADSGDEDAGRRWLESVADRGDADRLRARAGHDFGASRRLADVLTDRGEIDELRARADNHDYNSAQRLAELLADRGDLDGLRARADAGDMLARLALADILADRGEIDELRARLHGCPADFHAARNLVELLVQRGDLAEAQRVLLSTVVIGDHRAAERLPELLVRLGRHEQARHLARYGLNTDGTPATPEDVPS